MVRRREAFPPLTSRSPGMLARSTASITVMGLSGCSSLPFAAQVCMMRVVFVLPSPSDGPTGPVDIVATIAFSSQLLPVDKCLFQRFPPYVCPEPVLVNHRTYWMMICRDQKLGRTGVWLVRPAIPKLFTCTERLLFQRFPIFVPSLSWQTDRFYYNNGIAKSGAFCAHRRLSRSCPWRGGGLPPRTAGCLNR